MKHQITVKDQNILQVKTVSKIPHSVRFFS